MCDKNCKRSCGSKPQKIQHELGPNALKSIKIIIAGIVLIAAAYIDKTLGLAVGIGIIIYAMRKH